MTMMLLSGKSLASRLCCHMFGFCIGSHAMQAKVKATLVTISILLKH